MFTIAFLALAFNAGLFVYHIWWIAKTKRNPLKVELYPDAFGNPKLISETATDEVKQRIANRIGKTVQEAGFSR